MDKKYQSYYTKNTLITSYMASMISPFSKCKILEPCGGDGVFIDELLNSNDSFFIDTYDLDPNAIETLNKKYKNEKRVCVFEGDTLFHKTLDELEKNPIYDRVIGNPPYGAWLDYGTRDLLRKKYKGYYASESYSLFIIRCLNLLKDGGLLSFIIPDTYLFLNMHKSLRKTLLTKTRIKEILIFPSNFFPGVSFGYSNMSIITFEKCSVEETCLNNKITIINNFKNVNQFDDMKNRKLDKLSVKLICQKDIFSNHNHSFLLDDEVTNLINKSNVKLGDIANCVTGIYCGDNTKFIFALDENVKNSKNYSFVDKKLIYNGTVDNSGLDGEQHFIEIIKGSSETKFIRKEHPWFIDWSKTAIHHYLTDKKARFQNSSYYFQKGIAIPMVKSSKINATLMDGNVFDQSIVGIFCNDDSYVLYLLAFLNSDVANKIIHTINPTANNSANYLKQIPIIINESAQDKINEIMNEIIQKQDYSLDQLAEINKIFNNLYK